MHCGIYSKNIAFSTDINFYIVLYIDMVMYIEYSKYIYILIVLVFDLATFIYTIIIESTIEPKSILRGGDTRSYGSMYKALRQRQQQLLYT